MGQLEDFNDRGGRQGTFVTGEDASVGFEEDDRRQGLDGVLLGCFPVSIGVDAYGDPAFECVGDVGSGEDLAIHDFAGAAPVGMEYEEGGLVILACLVDSGLDIFGPGKRGGDRAV